MEGWDEDDGFEGEMVPFAVGYRGVRGLEEARKVVDGVAGTWGLLGV